MRSVRPIALLAVGLAASSAASTRLGAQDHKPTGLVASLPPEKTESHLYSVAFTKDGKSLVTHLEKNVHFWDTATWKETRKLTMPDGERRLELAPDGKTFAWLEGGHGKSPAAIYDAESGEPTLQLEQRPHFGFMNTIALVQDGKTLLAAGQLAGAPNLWRWDLATKKLEVTTLPGNEMLYALAASPDGKVVAAGFNGDTKAISVFEVQTGKELHRLSSGEIFAKSIGLSPDGKLLATSGFGEPVRLYDLTSGKLLAKLDHTYAACVRFSPDGKILLSSDREQLCLWSVETRKLLVACGRNGLLKEIHNSQSNANGPEAGACFSPDGKWVAWGCEMEEWGTVRVFDVGALTAAAK